jgi:hypothetical protein
MAHDRPRLGQLTVTLAPVETTSVKSLKSSTGIAEVGIEHAVAKVAQPKSSGGIDSKGLAIDTLLEQPQQVEKFPAKSGNNTSMSNQNQEVAENAVASREQVQAWKSYNPNKYPKHITLTYWIYSNSVGVRSGNIICQFDLQEREYILKTVQNVNNPLAILGISPPIQTTGKGKLGAEGLKPDTFINENSKTELIFDWSGRKLNYSDNSPISLPDKTQDQMSLLFQLRFAYYQSFYPRFQEMIPISVIQGHAINQYHLVIGTSSDIDTPIGKINALNLYSYNIKGQPGLVVWLGLDYFLLPVKFHNLDGNGDVIDEYRLADIQVSD